jgi:hypothetical protein
MKEKISFFLQKSYELDYTAINSYLGVLVKVNVIF